MSIPINRTPTLLAAIVGIADLMITEGNTEAAASALAFVIQHGQTSPQTRDRAEDLFDDLEASLCPRVIWDARDRAKNLSLTTVLLECGINL